jgi:putative ABC transport system ATP-binding protein
MLITGFRPIGVFMSKQSPAAASRSATPVAVFVARGLTKVYRMGEVEVQALRGVDLDIHAGEFVVLLGPSGSGKSTLLNILGGLDTPTAGSARFREHELSAASDAERTRYRREHVGFVFQFYNLIPSLTARENVALVTEMAADPMTADEALAQVGLRDRADHFPAQMSRSPSGPMCCCATSPPARSTTRPARRCWRRSCASIANWARPRW